MEIIQIKELPFFSQARICWGFMWRGLLTTIGSAISGAIVGGIAGFFLGIFGASKNSIAATGFILGFLCGLVFLYVYVRWLLSSRIGSFRLLLARADKE